MKDCTFSVHEYSLTFKQEAQTSRGKMQERKVWFIIGKVEASNWFGIGECAPIQGLSIENIAEVPQKLHWLCQYLNQCELPDLAFVRKELAAFPSVFFAFETLSIDMATGFQKMLFDVPFIHGEESLPINGLVWMGALEQMEQDLMSRLNEGYKCVKLKIGSFAFEKELALIDKAIALSQGKNLEIRVDANGAYSFEEARKVLAALQSRGVHSIEQPIKPRNWKEMRLLCQEFPKLVALDEELAGFKSKEEKLELLQEIKPAFIVIKPSLVGGLAESQEWIYLAENEDIGWWITSYLESNVGLNAISQFCASMEPHIAQGLGTGSLYTNNLESPLEISQGRLKFNRLKGWDFKNLANFV